jgi:hypothetical protein
VGRGEGKRVERELSVEGFSTPIKKVATFARFTRSGERGTEAAPATFYEVASVKSTKSTRVGRTSLVRIEISNPIRSFSPDRWLRL